MSEKIEPALSAPEWKNITVDVDKLVKAFPNPEPERHAAYQITVHRVWAAQHIAMANAALPDSDPRKITRETLAALTEVIGAAALWNQHQRETGRDMQPGEHALSIVTRHHRALESYLPPET